MNDRCALHAVTKARAHLATEYGPSMTTASGEDVVVLDDRVTEYEIARLVPFNIQKFLATGEPFDGLLPNAMVVPKNPASRPTRRRPRSMFQNISKRSRAARVTG